MKKLIAIIAVAFTVQIAAAQTQANVANFLRGHEIKFNQGQVPVAVGDIKALTDSLDKEDVSYNVVTYVFNGPEITEKYFGGGGETAIINKFKKPFIRYQIQQDGGKTILLVVDGSDAI